MIFVDGAIIAESPQRYDSTELKTGVQDCPGETSMGEMSHPGLSVGGTVLETVGPRSHAPSPLPISRPTGNCRHYFQLITEKARLGAFGRARSRSPQMAMGTCQPFV